jgi:hypothetical protein
VKETGSEVHLYSVCWNEIEMLGFFFRHYDPWVDRYVIDDDGSTDGTLDLLHAHPKVEVRSFERWPDSFVHAHTHLNNHAWKESRGTAAWVVLADIDEHLHHPHATMGDYLAEQRAAGVTLIPGLGFGMVHDGLPPDDTRLVDVVRRGRPLRRFNKLGIFDPDAVVKTGIRHGRHVASPVGDLRLPARDEVMLCHFKHLGFDRWVARDELLARRRGPRDVADRLGIHYFMTLDERRDFWAALKAESRVLGGPGFEPDKLARGRFWWHGLPRVRAPR